MMALSKPRRAIVAGLLLCAGLAALLARDRVAASAPPPQDRYAITASGRVDTAGEARFLVAERDARIAATLVRPGDHVVAGQPLLTLSCDDVAADLAAARATADAAAAAAALVAAGPRREALAEADARKAAADARAADARDQLQRAEGLRAAGFVSGRRLSELQASVAARAADLAETVAAADALHRGARRQERQSATATAASAMASAEALAAQLAKCTLRSPVAGEVLKLLRRPGEFSGSSTGTPLVVVGDRSALIVRAEIADRDAAGVSVGARAEIWLDGRARRWPGRVIETAALMGRKTARSLDPSDRFDRDVREVLLAFDGAPADTPVGLRVNVGLLP